ncbi:MAG TPA: ABC transporter permease, partial [Blastocatellia bacterium]|nr:ABC transporter permease [Blastocatellia bacterium]
AAVVTPDLFGALNLVPGAGRMFLPSDNAQGNQYLAVISYRLWQTQFAADRTVVGKMIDLNLVPHTVVGVAPPDFSFPAETEIDVWTVYPQSVLKTLTDRSARGYRVAGKLKPGVSLKRAQADMDVIASNLANQYPEDKGFGVILAPLREAVAGDVRTPLLALLAALGLVLLLTCVNIANLQLVRFEARRRELAVRTALGAARTALVRQTVIETAVLVIAGSGFGVLLAPAGVRILLSAAPPASISWLRVHTDRRVLLISIGITLLAALVSAVIPAIKASGVSINSALSGIRGATGTGAFSARMRNVFVVAQLALAVIPLSAAGLLVGTLRNLERVNPGFETDKRLTMSYFAPRARYKDPAQVGRLAEQVAEGIRTVPGVIAAGSVEFVPLGPGALWLQAIAREDPKQIQNPAGLPHVRYTVATSGYLEAMGIPLKAGRVFSKSDDANSAPVVVVNESLAKKYFPNESPIGQRIWIGHAQLLASQPPRIVVGVVADTIRTKLSETPDPSAWVPVAQQTFAEDVWRSLNIVVHTSGEPGIAMAGIREQLAKVDPDLALANIATMDERVSQSLWRERLTAGTMTSIGFVALWVAVLGVFAVISFLVTLRTNEIGVRIALGAQRGHILRMVMGEGSRLILIGAGLGVLCSLLLTKWLASLLYGVRPRDPLTLGLVLILLAGVGLLACYVPARRAMKVDPISSLRAE